MIQFMLSLNLRFTHHFGMGTSSVIGLLTEESAAVAELRSCGPLFFRFKLCYLNP